MAIRNRGTLGGSLAYADPAAEMPACCVALDASIVVAGGAGRREIPASQFYTGLFDTALEPGELIVEVRVPKQEATGTGALPSCRGATAILRSPASPRSSRRHRTHQRRAAGLFRLHRLREAGARRRAKTARRAAAAWRLRMAADAIAADLKPLDTPGLKARTKVQLATALTRRTLNDLQPGPAV